LYVVFFQIKLCSST